MRHLLLLSIIALLLFSACNNNQPDKAALYNESALLPDTLLQNISDWKVISTVYNRNHKTMSALYSRDSALCLVTWRQQDDQHWFGGRIPGNTESVEWVQFHTPNRKPSYALYKGNPLQKDVADTATVRERVDYIVSRKALVMP
jgi:hypothetical protein